jgi:hypothetical protein
VASTSIGPGMAWSKKFMSKVSLAGSVLGESMVRVPCHGQKGTAKHSSVWGGGRLHSRRHLPREGFRRVGGGWLRDEASPYGTCLAWNQLKECCALIGWATRAPGRHPLALLLAWTMWARALVMRLPGSVPPVRRLPSSASRRGAVPLLRP